MKSHYRVVVIGGGVVGSSVLYHLAKIGCSDVCLIERSILTAGSSWHAAGGFHALNADPNIASLQSYTIDLLSQIEKESGQSVGMHMTGGMTLAGTPDRWEWLQSAYRTYQAIGIDDVHLITPKEAESLCPILSTEGIIGGMWAEREGYLDTTGTVHAYAGAAKKYGAEVYENNRVLELNQTASGWEVVTEKGTVQTEKEIEALDKELPLVVDLEGHTYMRQDQNGMLLGIYEVDHEHWMMDGAPWDYGFELQQENPDRIEKELTLGFERFPVLQNTGVKTWVNGAFTFAPDGNPLVGPVRDKPGYWCACAVMAGFLQGGGVGKSLAEWIMHGEAEADVFGMDVARFGPYAANKQFIKETTGQFYSRRFIMTYPNEQLPAGRPLKMAPAYSAMTAVGCRWGAGWGLEIPLYFAPSEEFIEAPTLKRSNAFEIVANECKVVREAVGLLDISGFSRFEVSGDGAQAWLNHVMASKLPAPGQARLAPMLSPAGMLKGDLTVFNWGDGVWWIMGSYYLREWHMRWFSQFMDDTVSIRDIADTVVGFSLSGPNSRKVLNKLTDGPIADLPFMGCGTFDIGLIKAKVGRLSVAGELGYEIHCSAAEHIALRNMLLEAGADLGLREVGFSALLCLRLEKSFGIWSTEFTQGYTPGQTGMDRWIDWDKEFVGKSAAIAERDGNGPAQKLVTLEVRTTDRDATGFEPVWSDGVLVGFITSGGYGHTVGKSLAMAMVNRDQCLEGNELDVHIVGAPYKATVIASSPYDPSGKAMRS